MPAVYRHLGFKPLHFKGKLVMRILRRLAQAISAAILEKRPPILQNEQAVLRGLAGSSILVAASYATLAL